MGYMWEAVAANPALTGILAAVCVLVGVAMYEALSTKKDTVTGTFSGDTAMFTIQRELQCMQRISDGVEKMFDEIREDKSMTPAEIRVWKRRLANILELKDLLPKGQLTLRETIRGRLTHDKTPRPIPGVSAVPVPIPIKKIKDLRSILSAKA